MPICWVKFQDKEDTSRYNTHQVALVAILPDGEHGVIIHKRVFIKVRLDEVEWARYE